MKKIVYFCPECKEIDEILEEVTYAAHIFLYKNGEIKDEYPEWGLDYSVIVCRNCGKEFRNEPARNFEVKIEENNITIPENLKEYKGIIKEKISKLKGDKNE